MKNVYVSKHSKIPISCGLYKDHKAGRKFRILVNGNIGPVSNASEMLSLILKSYVQELRIKTDIDMTVRSTEELLAIFKNHNSKDDENKFIASMDVESLYPSMRTEDTAKVIEETVNDCETQFEIVSVRELLIFLRKNMSNEDIEENNLSEFMPVKLKKTKGKKYPNKYDLWSFSEGVPDKDMIKRLFAKALAVASKQLMDNHVYKFDDKIRVQTNKGSIGVEFTGIAAEIKMLKWCVKLREMLAKLHTKKISSQD